MGGARLGHSCPSVERRVGQPYHEPKDRQQPQQCPGRSPGPERYGPCPEQETRPRRHWPGRARSAETPAAPPSPYSRWSAAPPGCGWRRTPGGFHGRGDTPPRTKRRSKTSGAPTQAAVVRLRSDASRGSSGTGSGAQPTFIASTRCTVPAIPSGHGTTSETTAHARAPVTASATAAIGRCQRVDFSHPVKSSQVSRSVSGRRVVS